jgi:RNase H-fold protein (predicted Holliday junction resolvase)
LESHGESSNDDVISASQFRQFMSAVMKEFEDLKDKLSEKIEVRNKNLSDSLTKQFKEERESLKKEIANKLKSDIFDLTEVMDQLRKETELRVTSLRDNVNTVHEKLDDKMNENMSVVQRQIEKVSQKVNQEIEVLKERLATERASEDLLGSGSSEQNTVVDVNSTSHNTITLSGGVSETCGSHNESTCSDVVNVEIPHVNNTTVVTHLRCPLTAIP